MRSPSTIVLTASIAALILGCSSNEGGSTSNGDATGGTAGTSSSGGKGGAVSSSGGTTQSGGNTASGGSLAGRGGSTALGGSSGASGGGVAASGGRAAGGGTASGGVGGASVGGTSAAGGTSGTAGAGRGGAAGAAGNGASGGAGASSGGASGGAAGGGAGASSGGASGGSGGASGGSGGEITYPADPCAARTGYRNLYAELLGKSDTEIDAKLEAGYQSLFHGGGDETVYHEVGSDQAYILDVNSNDVRSEGMSYGMMISVQLDKKTEFDNLWRWAKSKMLRTSGAMAGLFAWQANTSGQVTGDYSAPDGEEYMATALIFASKRWGDGTGDLAYSTHAKNILAALSTKGDFNTSNHLVTFGVGASAAPANYTDPSYMLPAFYQVWACFDSSTASFWKSALTAARSFFQKTCNAQTGLAPYQANFDGSPYSGGGYFNSDSWRVVGNIMMDHHFYNADTWQRSFAQKFAAFFKTASAQKPVPDEFELNGSVRHTNADPAKGLVSQNALVAFGVPAADGTPFVQALWDTTVPTGQYRYYDGMLYMLASLHVSGHFRVW